MNHQNQESSSKIAQPGIVTENQHQKELFEYRSKFGSSSYFELFKISNDEFVFMGFKKKNIQLMILYGIGNIFRATILLIGGPFYPPEAASRGVSGTEIGIVFAVQDLTVCITSILYGKKIINAIGPQAVINLGFFGIGFCAILFGCLAFIDDRILFVVISILVKILTGVFEGGLYPAIFTIYSIETPDSISTSTAIFEIFFGIGAIGGPILCALLIEAVGFTFVYVTIGSCLIVSAVAVLLFVPNVEFKKGSSAEPIHDEENSEGTRRVNNPGFFKLLTIPTVLLVVFSLSTTSASIGFITATAALHYSYLTPTMMVTMFTTGTIIYTLTCPFWGYVSDHGLISKTTVMVGGAALSIVIGFLFLGQIPFLPAERMTWTGFIGVTFHGIGIGGSVMTAYHHALKAALLEGFPDNSHTYGLVSSLYMATFALGNTVGPFVSGLLYDIVGFRWGTMFIVTLGLLVILGAVLLECFQSKKIEEKKYKNVFN